METSFVYSLLYLQTVRSQGQGLLLAIPSDKRTIGTVQSRPVLMQWDPAGQIALPHHWVPTARGPQGQALSLLPLSSQIRGAQEQALSPSVARK